ncbi:hypothetical protein GA0070216_13532 [Micromonospora matsumotoense]|uniref:DNA-binding transcriptional activator of the SARP family n=1 Tax=Micromonospora matsumotoense TaxID=121616 RepID=A0A1C5AWW0_9ACTN|nr:hypothetical protein [Micromonospora matsumotoense]SCF49541.1 hypothetical protein GA0070216_13532 [Micromonospora matsumotoense]
MLLNDHDGNEQQLKQLAETGTATAALVVVLGERPDGPNWHLDSTGHLRDPHHPDMPSPRLCVLDQTATTDLLTVIASPDPAPPHPASGRPPLPYAGPPELPLPRQVTRNEPPHLPTTPRQRLHLRVLGDPQLLIDGEPLTIRRSAGLQVLVYLAIHPNGADTAQLTDAIWPGLPRHSLTGRLYTALSDLRSTIRTASDLPVIDHTDDRYRLNPTHIDVDLWQLHTTIHQAAATLTHTTTAWQTVLDAYPADLANTRTWPWLDPHREATRRRVIDLCAALATKEPDPTALYSCCRTVSASTRTTPTYTGSPAVPASTSAALKQPPSCSTATSRPFDVLDRHTASERISNRNRCARPYPGASPSRRLVCSLQPATPAVK